MRQAQAAGRDLRGQGERGAAGERGSGAGERCVGERGGRERGRVEQRELVDDGAL